jgi:hypothetical protein
MAKGGAIGARPASAKRTRVQMERGALLCGPRPAHRTPQRCRIGPSYTRPALASGALLLFVIDPPSPSGAASNAQAATDIVPLRHRQSNHSSCPPR